MHPKMHNKAIAYNLILSGFTGKKQYIYITHIYFAIIIWKQVKIVARLEKVHNLYLKLKYPLLKTLLRGLLLFFNEVTLSKIHKTRFLSSTGKQQHCRGPIRYRYRSGHFDRAAQTELSGSTQGHVKMATHSVVHADQQQRALKPTATLWSIANRTKYMLAVSVTAH